MKSQFAEDVLGLHRELWAAARRADQEGGRYLEALEAGDAPTAGRTQVQYRDQLLAIVQAARALDALMEHGTPRTPGTSRSITDAALPTAT